MQKLHILALSHFWKDCLKGLSMKILFCITKDVKCVSNMSKGLCKVQIYGLHDTLNLSKSYTSYHEKGS